MKVVSLRMPDELLENIRKDAESQGKSQAAVMLERLGGQANRPVGRPSRQLKAVIVQQEKPAVSPKNRRPKFEFDDKSFRQSGPGDPVVSAMPVSAMPAGISEIELDEPKPQVKTCPGCGVAEGQYHQKFCPNKKSMRF